MLILSRDLFLMSKGKKTPQGYPELYDEVKKRVNLSLTPTAIAGLDELAQKFNVSRSEFVEQVGRNLIPIAGQKSLSEEYIISPIKSQSFTQRDRLPEVMGAFLITDWSEFAYVGSSSNLCKRFEDLSFLESIANFQSLLTLDDFQEQIDILWIKCDCYSSIPKIEQQLLAQFHHFSFSLNSFIKQK